MLPVTLLLIWIVSVKQVFIIMKQIPSLVHYCHAGLPDCSTAVTLPLLCPQCSSTVSHHPHCPLPYTTHLLSRYSILNSFPVIHHFLSCTPPCHLTNHLTRPILLKLLFSTQRSKMQWIPRYTVDHFCTKQWLSPPSAVRFYMMMPHLRSCGWSSHSGGSLPLSLPVCQQNNLILSIINPNEALNESKPVQTEKKTQQLVNFQNLLVQETVLADSLRSFKKECDKFADNRSVNR